jgi:hypothetical protein
MDAKSILVGALLGSGIAGSASIAASPELLEKFGSLYATPVVSEFHVSCSDKDKCEVVASVVAEPKDAEAVAVGVQPLRWSEVAICPQHKVQKFVDECGERANKQAPAVFVDKRRDVVDGVVVEVAAEPIAE